jgi:hypothetical protein
MTVDYRTLSILLHAQSKEGKTTLAATAPGRKLVLDAEGGWKWIAGSPDPNQDGKPYRRVDWDPTQPPPEDDGSWDICVVTVQQWETVSQVYQWLRDHSHPFEAFVMDSITEIQRRCRANLSGPEAMQIQDWGILLNRMEGVIRGFRDLANAPGPIRTVVFIAETELKNGKWRPAMQGKIGNALPYWMDVVGYLFTEGVPDENGQDTGKKIKKLLVGQSDQFEAGERVQGRIPDIVSAPNLTDIMNRVYPGFSEEKAN